jgi:hypothetical protein
MKSFAILLASAVLALLPGLAPAADEPEVVYGKYHRAAMSGDIDEMMKWLQASRRTELQGASPATRSAALTLAQHMMPRGFAVQRKSVNPNGRATLVVSGAWDGGQQKLETVYGTIKMVWQGGEWKVDESSWGSEKPAILLTPKPAPAVEKGAARAAAPTKGAPVVGSMNSALPVKPLGEAKPECVYKPVMTAEDVERCR